MAHFAKVVNGVVTQVIVAEPEFFETFIDTSAGTWLQTSYNTISNTHTQGGTPLRGNFASVGGVYDSKNDVFYASQPFPSWVLNESNWTWEAPTPMPKDDKLYAWDEATTSWKEIK
jgi:hypothetical protein